jgi:membrane-bound lytic murein transglycosylase B
VDAVGSVANYFSQHGWRTGEPVAVPAVARGREPQVMKADYTTRYRLDSLANSGVTASVPLSGQAEVSLLRLDAVGGYEYWLGLGNFYTITRYNHSTYYAMAAHQLAKAVRERRERVDGPVLTRRPGSAADPAL